MLWAQGLIIIRALCIGYNYMSVRTISIIFAITSVIFLSSCGGSNDDANGGNGSGSSGSERSTTEACNILQEIKASPSFSSIGSGNDMTSSEIAEAEEILAETIRRYEELETASPDADLRAAAAAHATTYDEMGDLLRQHNWAITENGPGSTELTALTDHSADARTTLRSWDDSNCQS